MIIPAQQIHYDSIVVEEKETYRVRQTPLNIIENSCARNWSNLKGRIEASQKLMNYIYKPPIIVSEHQMIFAFPTRGIDQHACAWIFLDSIRSIHKVDKLSAVTLNNGQRVTLDISYHTLKTQRENVISLVNAYKQDILQAGQYGHKLPTMT